MNPPGIEDKTKNTAPDILKDFEKSVLHFASSDQAFCY